MMRRLRGFTLGIALSMSAACQSKPSAYELYGHPPPILMMPELAWSGARFGTYDNAAFARLFTEIGGYDAVFDDGRVMRLQQGGQGAEIILEQLPREAPQARPPDAESWEPGCYWSLMVRAKDLASIVEDARPLGWDPRTPIAFLEFGPSQLHIVVLTHQETGAQVQFYERLTTPLPNGYPEFERFGVPFNVMQMSSNAQETWEFFRDEMGFEAFYQGDFVTSEEPEVMPLGIPVELTTTVPYRAIIVTPRRDMETGRFEMIQVQGERAGLKSRDFSANCGPGSVGLTEIRYLKGQGIPFVGYAGYTVWQLEPSLYVAPDGARIVIEK